MGLLSGPARCTKRVGDEELGVEADRYGAGRR